MSPLGWIVFLTAIASTFMAFRMIPRFETDRYSGTVRAVAQTGNIARFFTIINVFFTGWLCSCALVDRAWPFITYALINALIFIIADVCIERSKKGKH